MATDCVPKLYSVSVIIKLVNMKTEYVKTTLPMVNVTLLYMKCVPALNTVNDKTFIHENAVCSKTKHCQ